MKTLALIPARGGSKGIPRKNINMIAGKPLIAWTIEAALASTLLDGVVVSTDNAEIAEVALRYGAQVPFLRPAELARDETPGVEPVLHALQQLPDYDAVLLLQPTSPLRSSADIDACLALAREREAVSVVSVSEPDAHPDWMYRMTATQQLEKLLTSQSHTRRQDLPTVLTLNGALYFANADWLRRSRTLLADETLAYVMPADRSVDIDTPLDWKFAELLLNEKI
ncbi:acylneuraminate cytidylyltransferase family protein [Janthinobacterium sp. SUN118]|uniref:acylneuraminate cytidylyltransferase family protein n=1 Tax=Janthinobacterium sp. SUN118 TaxID=3004100 RepID=UPI0025B1EAC2|nr:acylneuraminate cytidylyltransferase family protein [Janthinobacterium sp. SUN118]MDN2708440.1 acylneuraminate cytidylyltransferase family protein [Janthinobacterium sp. SUN118]